MLYGLLKPGFESKVRIDSSIRSEKGIDAKHSLSILHGGPAGDVGSMSRHLPRNGTDILRNASLSRTMITSNLLKSALYPSTVKAMLVN